jgi:hypothetical protein
MKTNFAGLLILTLAGVLLTGCVRTVDGHLKPGVPFAKDKIESRYERPVNEIFAAAKAVLADNGTLVREDTINKTVEAKVDTRTVRVKVQEQDPTVSHVVVQVRTKGGGSDVDLASEIDKQIALRLLR